MKNIIMVLVIILMSACTTYDVKRDSEGIVSVKVKSTRSFEAPDLRYKRGTDGLVEFDFSAQSVDQNAEIYMGAFSSMMQFMQQMMLNMAQPVE